MRPGPAPKPTRMKILAGNPGKRPLNDQEPDIAPSTPTIPAHLDADARREWRRIVKRLEPIGMLTQLDRAVLAMYCQVYARWTQAERKLNETGLIVKAPSGYPILSPYLSICSKCVEQLHRLSGELGFTPASRTKVRVAPKKPKAKTGPARFFRPRDGAA